MSSLGEEALALLIERIRHAQGISALPAFLAVGGSTALSATASTRPVWPWSVRTIFPLSRSHTRNVWSHDPEMARRPSGVTTTAAT